MKQGILATLAILALSVNPLLHAADKQVAESLINPFNKPLTLERALKISAIVAFAASLIKYACTEPHNDPIRYNTEEAKTAINELGQGINVQENLVKLRDFSWYFILDGIIGHGVKKRSIRMDPDEPSKLLVHPGAKAKGLYGMIAGYHKGIFAMLFFMNGMKKFHDGGIKGWNGLVRSVGLD